MATTFNKQLNKPRVLCGVPITEHKAYIDKQWFKHLLSLTYPNLDFYFVDNSVNPKYHHKWKQQGWNVGYYRPEGMNLRQIMCDCNNIIRQYVIDNNYDYWFMLEEDQFAQPNIIEKLMANNKDICSAGYFVYHAQYSQFLNTSLFGSYTHPDAFIKTLEEGFLFVDGTVKEAYNHGIGCMLIKTDVIKQLKFWIDEADEGKNFSDSYFQSDLRNLGYKSYIDTDIMTMHINGNWGVIQKNVKI